MDRIRQALKQAEEKRAKNLDDGQSEIEISGATEVAAAANITSVTSGAADATSADQVEYKKTKVVDVSPITLEQNRLVAGLPDHELTDAYRILRTRVLQSMNSNRWNALAVTSPATGCGKTLTSINLAISLAREINRTVLLADFDLRRPSIHSYFGYQPELGLSDYFFNNAQLQDILFTPSVDRLVVLPGRESIHNSSEMLRAPICIELVEELKSRYPDRLVIFDLPPILEVDDALAFAPYTDAMLMVAENGATQRNDLESALGILKNTPLIGTVLNKSTVYSAPY